MNDAYLAVGLVSALALAGAAQRGARNEVTHAYYDADDDAQITGLYEGQAVTDIYIARSPAELNARIDMMDDVRFTKLPRGLGGYLGGIELPKEARGKGIGEQLVRKMLDIAREQGLQYVVILSESRPRSFWRKMGFVETSLSSAAYRGLTPMIWRPSAESAPEWLAEVGDLTHRWTQTNESLALLDELHEGMDWGQGGCAVLARALCLVEPRLEQYGIFDAQGRVQHLYAGHRLGSKLWLIDRDGLQSEDQAKRVFLKDISGAWRLTPDRFPISISKLTAKTKMGEILCSAPFSSKAAKGLKAHAASRKGSSSRLASWADVNSSMMIASKKHAGGPRDARHAVPRDAEQLQWSLEKVQLADRKLNEEPWSKRDVDRYAKRMRAGEYAPPVVLVDRDSRFEIVDGAHRISAARLAGLTKLPAWIGRPSGSRAKPFFRRLERVPPGFTQEAKPFILNTVLEEVPNDGLYHVTTNLSAVLASGRLMSRAELHRMNVNTSGLGGGFWNEAPDVVSVAVSRESAFRVLRGVVAMAGAAQGKMRGYELLETLQDLSSRTLQMLDSTADYLEEDDSTRALSVAYRDEEKAWERDVERAHRGPEMYDAGKGYEQHLSTTVHEWIVRGYMSDDDMICGGTVGFTEGAHRFEQISIENLGIVRLAAKRSARPSLVPQECELRFKPQDLQIISVLQVPKRMLRVLA